MKLLMGIISGSYWWVTYPEYPTTCGYLIEEE
jgi:hypothetical protein